MFRNHWSVTDLINRSNVIILGCLLVDSMGIRTIDGLYRISSHRKALMRVIRAMCQLLLHLCNYIRLVKPCAMTVWNRRPRWNHVQYSDQWCGARKVLNDLNWFQIAQNWTQFVDGKWQVFIFCWPWQSVSLSSSDFVTGGVSGFTPAYFPLHHYVFIFQLNVTSV